MKKKNNQANRPWRERLNNAYRRFLKLRGEPREIALGFALGIMIGMSPFFGVHIVLAVFLAAIFKWSKLTAAIGVQITNVFTAPFIYPIIYWVGSRVLGISEVPSLDGVNLSSAIELIKRTPLIMVDLLVGGIILGLPLSIASYWIVLKTIENYRSRIKPRFSKRRKRRPRKRR
jgi:uncharacterized protein